ncbi:MAG TPA: LOG family protein [Acidimicrobiales bacterium]|nr:LOG family protein [Acidimicrobiales bacterium]
MSSNPDLKPRGRTTGDVAIDKSIRDLLETLAPPRYRDQLQEILVSVADLAHGPASRLDVKIANAALREMVQAFEVFAPFRDAPKMTMFGSARTSPEDPVYAQARDLARRMADEGWLVVTGAGPGIMAAGFEGAGRERSLGVNIRLPFEQSANALLGDDPARLVEMRYFFTRKLMLMKESAGFVCLPGGFGTLDEAFELLTLLQTGKAEPAPVVFLNLPGGTYWQGWERFVREEVAARGLIDEADEHLYLVTDDVSKAAGELLGFFRNYHSRRWVGDLMVVRLKGEPSDQEIAELQERFADISTDGVIRRTRPLPVEKQNDDHLQLPRIALRFDRFQHGRLRLLIDAVNDLPSAPAVTTRPPTTAEGDEKA